MREIGLLTESEQEDFEERLRRQIEAYHESALLYAAVKLGLPDRMGKRRWAPEQLAHELTLSAPHLHRVLRGLCTTGLCEERSDQTFALTPFGQSLASGSHSRLAEKVQIVIEQYWQPWAKLVANLETGKPAFEHVFGMTVFDWRRAHAEHGAQFDAYVAKETLAQAGPIIEALDFSGAGTVADIGGGYGGLLAAILQAHRRLAGILFDRPPTIEAARSFLQSQGVADRVQLVGGDLLAGIPIQADLYLLKGMLQQWDDEEAAAILRNCRAAMPGGAKLVIIERLLPDRALDDPAAIMLDLHMMAITGGRARSLEQFAVLLSQAGLALSTVTPTYSGLSLITALPEEAAARGRLEG
jgi:SAM-dependent methyltransferase